ncbi:MAG: sel1 repeat family protein [Magnetococcales bacterium]|nr:sel1 repeat family protein [Magnetococcales bacterium]
MKCRMCVWSGMAWTKINAIGGFRLSIPGGLPDRLWCDAFEIGDRHKDPAGINQSGSLSSFQEQVASMKRLLILVWIVGVAVLVPMGNQGHCAGFVDTLFIRVAATFGDAHAQYNLGLMYESGDGVKKDLKKAWDWFHKSAAQGLPDAQNKLGIMYEHKVIGGLRNKKDKAYAYAYYHLAALKGNKDAAENRDILGRAMSSQELEDGQSMIMQFSESSAGKSK